MFLPKKKRDEEKILDLKDCHQFVMTHKPKSMPEFFLF